MSTLKFDVFRQNKNSQWCGPACLALIFNLFGENYSVPGVAKKLPISKEYGIGLFDLALFPLREGYAVDLYAWDAHNFPVAWRLMSQRQLMRTLEKSNPKRGSWQKALLSILKSGARFYPHPITTSEIEKRLKNHQGAILYIDSAVLYQHANGVWGHYVVLKKTSQKIWTIFDPHWRYGGLRHYQKDSMLFAFYSVGGYCLFVSPKRKRSARHR